MQDDYTNKEKKGTPPKSGSAKEHLATPNRVEITPRGSVGVYPEVLGAASQSRQVLPTVDCSNGGKGRSMAVHVSKTQRPYRGVLWTVWFALAIWLVKLRSAPETKIASSIPKIPQRQGQRKEQDWEGGTTSTRRGEAYYAQIGENLGAEVTGLQKAEHCGGQGELGGEDALHPGKGGSGSITYTTAARGSSTAALSSLEGCGRRKSNSFGCISAGNQSGSLYVDNTYLYRVQRCPQGGATVGKGSGKDEESLRNPQEDERRLVSLDQTGSRSLQSQGQAVRGGSPCLDIGLARRSHSRESSQSRTTGFGANRSERRLGRDRARRQGVSRCLRCYITPGNGVHRAHEGFPEKGRAYGGERHNSSRKRRFYGRKRIGTEIGGSSHCRIGQGLQSHAREETSKGEEHAFRRRTAAQEQREEGPREGKAQARQTRLSSQRKQICPSWWRRHGWCRADFLKINKLSYTQAFTDRVNALIQRRRDAEQAADLEPDEGEESEDGEDDNGRTPEEQRDLETSIVYFSQGFRILLLRHQALAGGGLFHIFHIPAHWAPTRTVTAVEDIWHDLQDKSWLLIYARDPTKDSMVARPGEVVALVVVRDELPPNKVPIAQEIDLTAHSTSFRQQDLSQEFRALKINRGQLLEQSGYYDFCDATRNERRWHCFVFVDGEAWLDEIERNLKPGSHVLIRINPRLDLPPDDFYTAEDQTTPFREANFPIRSVYTTIAFHQPWTLTHTALLDSYNQQTWFLHDFGRVDVDWWSIWRISRGDRTEIMWLPRPIQREAWRSLDEIHRTWTDVTNTLWELVEPDKYWRLSPTMRHHEFLALLLNEKDTSRDEVLLICEQLPTWTAWVQNAPPVLTLQEALAFFAVNTTDLQSWQLWHNGDIHHPQNGDLQLRHGDILSISGDGEKLGTTRLTGDDATQNTDTTPFEHAPSSSRRLTGTRSSATGPFSAIISSPHQEQHAFSPNMRLDPTTAIITFSFTEEFTQSVRALSATAAPFPNHFGRRGHELPEDVDEVPQRTTDEDRILRTSTNLIIGGQSVLCLRFATEHHGDLYSHITFDAAGTPDDWIRAVHQVWPPLTYVAWRFLNIHDPIRDSEVIRPSQNALLIAVEHEGRWPRVRVAFEIDKLDRTFTNRIMEVTQQQVPTAVNRIQLIAFSDFADLCDGTRNERSFHCHVFLNGRPLLNEEMQVVSEGFHILLRIIPRQDLPLAHFHTISVPASGFEEHGFPSRVIHSSRAPISAPWTLAPNAILRSYCAELWNQHGGDVLTHRWFTVWRVRSPIFHRNNAVRVRKVQRDSTWIMIDRIHSRWPDLQARQWHFIPVHGSYTLSPSLARHAQLVLLFSPVDTPHNCALVVLNIEGQDAWAANLPRRTTIEQLRRAFGILHLTPQTNFLQNGIPLAPPIDFLAVVHGDVFTFQEGLRPERPARVAISTSANTTPPAPSHRFAPYNSGGRDYGGYTRRATGTSGFFGPTDSFATISATPGAEASFPVRTFYQLEAIPTTHSFTDEFFDRWRTIMTARQGGTPPPPMEPPQEIRDFNPGDSHPALRVQVLRSLRIGWNTIWRRHQRPGVPHVHPGDPFDFLELDIAPQLTAEDVFALIFAYWPDLRIENQWFLATADDSIVQARGTLPWRGQLLFLNSILDGRPGHQILGFELPRPRPFVLRYVPVALTYLEARHHLLALPEEHLLLNGIPWAATDVIEVADGDFLCARILPPGDEEFGNDVALNFRISRPATPSDVSSGQGGTPRLGDGGFYSQDRPTHPVTPDPTDSEQDLVDNLAAPLLSLHYRLLRQREGNKVVSFSDEVDLLLFDDTGHFNTAWDPEQLILDEDPFPLPAYEDADGPSTDEAHFQAAQAPNTIAIFDMDTERWAHWAWETTQPHFDWLPTNTDEASSLQSCGTFQTGNITDLHDAVTKGPWNDIIDTTLPSPGDGYWYHPNTMCALPYVCVMPAAPIVRLHLYTDGSYQSGGMMSGTPTAAWAVVIFAQTSCHTIHYWGHLAAACEATSAFEAEIDAMAVALLFSYFITSHQALEIEIGFDCTSADYVTSFPSRAASKYPTNVLRGLSQAVQTHAGLRTRHIRGHQGDPYNEMANTFANAARLQQKSAPEFLDHLFDLLLDDPDAVQWLWAVRDPALAGFAPHGDGATWLVPAPRTACATTAENFLQGRRAAPPLRQSDASSAATLSLGLATHNVLTLNDYSKRGTSTPPQPSARLSHLEVQWAKECHLVGLQETRTYKETCVGVKSGFVILSSADKGKGGCGLYVNTRDAYGGDLNGPFHFSRKHFTIVESQPEILIIRARAPHFAMVIVIAHAPSLDKGEEARALYWNNVAHLLGPHAHDPVLLLTDANDELDTGSPTAFSSFLCDQRLVSPACDAGSHNGQQWTHTSAKGGLRKRLDYVCIPQQWTEQARLVSRVAYEADVAISRDDHELVILKVDKRGDGSACRHYRATVPYQNPQRPASPAHDFWRQRLHHAYGHFQQIADFRPSSSVDQHAMALHKTLLHEACQVYPQAQLVGRKPYVSQHSLLLIKQRSQIRRLRLHWQTRCHLQTLACCFGAWKGRQVTSQPTLRREDHNVASLCRALDATCSLLRYQLACDKRDFFETLGGSIPRDTDDRTLTRLWPLLKFALPKQACKPARTLPREQMTANALQHFAGIESGKPCGRQFLWDWHCRTQSIPVASTFEQGFLPTLAEVEGVIAGFKHYKAPGEDLLTADLLQAGGAPIAKLILPLVLKCFATGLLPLCFQGATLIPLYKGKGPADSLDSYRSIVLAPTLAKLVQALLRRRLMPYITPHFVPFQLGGKPRGQVAFCTQAVRAFLNIARCKRRPAAVLFIDVKQAFYSLPRHHAVGPYLTEAEYQWLVTSLDCPAEERTRCEGTYKSAILPTALMDVPQRLMTLLRSLVKHGWLVDQHEDSCAFTLTGTRPGLPLADLLFNVAMIDVLRQVSADLRTQGITTTLHADPAGDGPQAYPIVAWQDDVAIAFDADSNEELRSRMHMVVTSVLQRFEAAHMTINFAKGKTELIAAYRGTGATQLQRQDVVVQGGMLTLTDRQVDVVTVARYKHLGSLIHVDSDMDAEIWARIGTAQEALRLLRKGAFRVQGLTIQCRIALLESLVFSRLFYNVATWVTIHRPGWKAMNQFYHRAVRAAVKMPLKDASGDSHGYALRKAGLPDLATQLRLRRLQHLGHLAQSGPAELHRVLASEEDVTTQSWGALVASDIDWLRQCGGDFAQLAPVYGGGIVFLPWVQGHLRHWKGWLRRARTFSLSLQSQEQDLLWFRRQMKLALPETGVTFTGEPFRAQVGHPCPTCGVCFDDEAALASHCRMKHGQQSAHAPYCSGSICPVCLYECFSTDRLLWHMKQSAPKRPCLQWAQQHLLPEAKIERVALPAALQGHKRIRGHYTFGPHMPTIQQRMDTGYLGRYAPLADTTLSQGSRPQGLTQATASSTPHVCWSLIDGTPLQDWLTACVQTGEWTDPFIAEDLADYRPCCFSRDFGTVLDLVTTTDEVDLIRVCEDWGQRVDKQLRTQGGPTSGGPLHGVPEPAQEKAVGHGRRPPDTTPLFDVWQHPEERIRAHQAQDQRQQPVSGVVGPKWPDPRVAIRLNRPTYYVLHLFSGHARQGDLAWWVDKVTQFKDFAVRTIAFDVVHHSVKGDLTNEQTFQFLLRLLRSGRVLALQAGPPCETWSCARHQVLEGFASAPRPLRSAQCLWGIQGLTLREQLQVESGNLLYQRTLILVAWAVVFYVAVLVEHPAEPEQSTYASTWRLPQTRWLLRAPGVTRMRVRQWEWGQVAVKPTDFLVAHLPSLGRRLGETRLAPQDRPKLTQGGARGKDETGAWRTSPLKVYPSAMCHGFALAFNDVAARLWSRNGPTVIDEPFVEWVQTLSERGSHMGPDWHGHARS